jgi:hypothetical protein
MHQPSFVCLRLAEPATASCTSHDFNFVIGVSDTFTESDFNSVKCFYSSMADVGYAQSRIATLVLTSSASILFDFKTLRSLQDVKNAILSVPYDILSPLRPSSAFAYAQSLLTPSSGFRGQRASLVYITNSPLSDDVLDLELAVVTLECAGVEVFPLELEVGSAVLNWSSWQTPMRLFCLTGSTARPGNLLSALSISFGRL